MNTIRKDQPFRIRKEKLNGTDTDLMHVIAYCMAIEGFTIPESTYKQLPEMFKQYFTNGE